MALDWRAVAESSVHPTQLAILELLEEHGGRRSPVQMAEELGERLGNVSYHVRALASAGLLRAAGRRPRRGAVEHFYRLAARAVA